MAQLEETFVCEFNEHNLDEAGNLLFPSTVTVSDCTFVLAETKVYTSGEVVARYTHENNNILVRCNEGKIAAADVVTLVEAKDATAVEDEFNKRIIGKTTEVVVFGINGNAPIQAKVDTGATICSIDASDIKEQNAGGDTMVSFVFSDRRYSMQSEGKQAVSSADGGVKYRHTVRLNVKLNGQVFEQMLFNLNDRSDMDYPILIGLNVLTAGKFLIDPQQESKFFDWTSYEAQTDEDDAAPPELTDDDSDIHEPN